MALREAFRPLPRAAALLLRIRHLRVATFSDAEMRSQQQWQHPNRQFPAERIAHAAAMRNEPAANFTSNLPIIVLESEGDYVSHDDRTPVRAAFYTVCRGVLQFRQNRSTMGLERSTRADTARKTGRSNRTHFT